MVQSGSIDFVIGKSDYQYKSNPVCVADNKVCYNCLANKINEQAARDLVKDEKTLKAKSRGIATI